MAGAEGFEPSALGFGVAVEKILGWGTSCSVRAVEGFQLFRLSVFDAILMLCRNSAGPFPPCGQVFKNSIPYSATDGKWEDRRITLSHPCTILKSRPETPSSNLSPPPVINSRRTKRTEQIKGYRGKLGKDGRGRALSDPASAVWKSRSDAQRFHRNQSTTTVSQDLACLLALDL